MLFLVDDVDQQWRRDGTRPPGLVILGEGPEKDRLGRDAERRRAEGGRRLDRLDGGAAGLQEPLAASPRRGIIRTGGRVREPLPLQAHPADPEVIPRVDAKPQRVGLEQHVPVGRQIQRDHRGRLVGLGHDRERQGPAPVEAVGVPPGKFDGGGVHDRNGRRSQGRPLGLDRLAVHRGRRQLAIGRGHERHAAALDRRECPAANLLPNEIRATQIARQRHLGDEALDLRPQHRLDRGLLPPVTHGHRDPRRLELRRHRDRIAIATQLGLDPLLPADLDRGPLGPRAGGLGESHLELGRLPLRHDDRLGQGLDPGEGESLHGLPGGEEPGPGIGRGVGHGQRRGNRQTGRHGRREQPGPMPRPRHGRTEIDAAGPLGHLGDGRPAKRG